MLCLASIISFFAAGMLLWLAGQTLLPPWDTAACAAAAVLLTASFLCSATAYNRERATRSFAGSLSLAFAGLFVWQLGPMLQPSWVATLVGPLTAAAAPALMALGALPALGKAWALWSMRHAPLREPWRVAAAGRAQSTVVCCCITFAALNLTSLTFNRKWDASYFKTTQVSPATRNVLAGLNQKVTITLFFPPGNDVLEQVRGYFEAIRPLSRWLDVTVLDQALEPERARALKVRRNGTVAIHSGNKTELLRLDMDVEQARAALRRLDGDVRHHVLRVTEPQGVIYVTDGHGERSFEQHDDSGLLGLRDFKTLMENQGFELRPLGLAEGLGQAIPADASMVAIMGPSQRFGPQEIKTLEAYLAQGGHLLLCLDPDRDDDNGALAGLAQVTVGRARVGNPHYQVRAQNSGTSPFNLVTVRVSGHPSVQSLEAHPGRLGLILLGAGEVRAHAPWPSTVLTPIVLGMPDSFVDNNANGVQDNDGNEPAKQDIVLAMAVQWPGTMQGSQARAIVVGDVDLAVDGIVRNVGNSALMSDTAQWLAGSRTGSTAAASEEDVPIVHRKDKDALWFYGVSFGMPLLVFAIGLFVHERDSKRLRRPQGTIAGAPKDVL